MLLCCQCRTKGTSDKAIVLKCFAKCSNLLSYCNLVIHFTHQICTLHTLLWSFHNLCILVKGPTETYFGTQDCSLLKLLCKHFYAYMLEEEPGEWIVGQIKHTTKLIVKETLEFCFSNCVDWYFVDIKNNVLYILILE